MLGTIINAGLKLAKTSDLPNPEAIAEQEIQLRKMLRFARHTAFGMHHRFSALLKQKDLVSAFQQAVPTFEYDEMYRHWWIRSRHDEPNVTWPGVIPYYALSSGTSAASSKYIPVTRHMLRAMSKGSMRLFFDLAKYKLSAQQLRKPMLMVGSCTALQPEGRHFTGDLSGIIGLNRPLWLANYYRPGRDITDLPDWGSRIEAITIEAHKWDIGFAVGNPAWVQLIFEHIIDHYGLTHIHDIWPNLNMYVHGGVFFEPYKRYFDQLLGKKVHCVDSYMASEGFFAYQNRPEAHALRLMTDCGVYYEFVPLNSHNFDENGHLKPDAKVVTLAEVSENEQYALLISTCSGAWRYLLGDTIQFTDLSRTEFKITGRTGQFLSVCGEHISIDNLNEAVRRADHALQAGVIEFAVAGLPCPNGGWQHRWYVSMQNTGVSATAFAQAVDESLCLLNDDYAVERRYALHEVQVEILPKEVFYAWLAQRGKLNGQAKIPRVLKNEALNHWMDFLAGRPFA